MLEQFSHVRNLLVLIVEYNYYLFFRSSFYIIEHGMAQQSGKHTGTTAAPDLLDFLAPLSASYSYLPLPLAQPP